MSAACSDVYRAMTAAYPQVDSNSPVAKGATCDYYSLLEGFFHPSEGKPTAECIVRPATAQQGGLVIELTASYGSWW